MGARRKFSAEYKREAVAMLDAPGVTVSQIAADLGIGANVLARRRALWPPPGSPLNAPGRLAGRPPAATLAPEDGRCPTRWNAESFGTGFHRTAPNTKWVTDITYIRTAEHWLYLCIVLDLYSGLVVGWSMSPRQDRQLVVQAVLMAVWQRPGRTPVILHSDHGCQFMSDEYQQFLAAHHVTCSMSAVGSCADNAAAESFFGGSSASG